MSLALFKYALPTLLGYLLFVGIGGRIDPVSRPRRLEERPPWAFGLWAGAVVALVLTVTLHTSDATSIGQVRVPLAPNAWALLLLLLPGLLLWLVYRDAVARTLDAEARAHRESSVWSARIADIPVAAPGSDGDAGTAAGSAEDASVDANASAGASDDVVARDVHEIALGVAEEESGTLCLALREEERRREEAETRLSAARDTLSRHDLQSRFIVGEKADVLIALEEELESRLRESAIVEVRTTRETARRVEAETVALALERQLLAARGETRRGAEARARALAAAAKSVALARQAMQARERVEMQLHGSEAAIVEREATIGRLVRALETEKRRTREVMAALARQQAPHERQRQARRGLETAPLDAAGTPSGRLARKVARARPLTPGD